MSTYGGMTRAASIKVANEKFGITTLKCLEIAGSVTVSGKWKLIRRHCAPMYELVHSLLNLAPVTGLIINGAFARRWRNGGDQ